MRAEVNEKPGVIEKPSYGTSKQHLFYSSLAAWTVIFMLTSGAVYQGEAVAFATVALPSIVVLLAAMLGIHRGFGSVDMRTMARGQEGDRP